MLVSLCAGGVGINLTGGNHLFLIDMHWYSSFNLVHFISKIPHVLVYYSPVLSARRFLYVGYL